MKGFDFTISIISVKLIFTTLASSQLSSKCENGNLVVHIPMDKRTDLLRYEMVS